ALLMHTPEIEVRATHLTPEDFARADDIKFVCDWYHEPITVGGNLNGTHVSHGMCVSCKNKFLDGQPLPNKTTVNQF
ncbi:MAG: hypothetical protein JWM68_3741, partial [Verrucomicrobiales bacterium]|nr:hypothetical protein [Verrucomicrobiales bacterium]